MPIPIKWNDIIKTKTNMVETVYTTPTGVKLFKNGYGMLFSPNIVEVKISLTKDTYSDDYYKSMTAIDLLDEIDHQTILKPKIEKAQINGIISNGTHFLSGFDSNGHFIIDGKTYLCDLDPDDGYGRISSSLEECSNIFDPIEVYIQWYVYSYMPNDKDDENREDVYMTITHNEKVIAKMGTHRFKISDWTHIFEIDESLSI